MEKKSQVIKLSPNILHQIQAQASGIYPRECCGILVGNRDPFTVKELYTAANQRAEEGARGHFLIDPLEMYDVERKVADKNMEIIGFYHSHPDCPARLSAEDERNMIPGFVYTIVSVIKQECRDIRSYMKQELDEDAFEICNEC